MAAPEYALYRATFDLPTIHTVVQDGEGSCFGPVVEIHDAPESVLVQVEADLLLLRAEAEREITRMLRRIEDVRSSRACAA